MGQEQRSYEFGPFRLIPSERLLLRAGEPVPLAPKAFDTLVALVRRAGRLAEKEELLQEIWPGAFVEESNLAQNVFTLRRALAGDDGDAYIETVPKRGYRFVGAVRVVDDSAEAPAARRARSRLPLIGILTALAVIGVAAWLVKLWRSPDSEPAFQTMRMTRLTTSGNISNVAISPDGKYVAHAVRDKDQQSLWVRQTETPSVLQLVAPASVGYVGVTFSPDGNYIYYNVSSRSIRTLFMVPALGGTPRKILEGLRGGAVSFSPDGRRFAFIRVTPGEESALMIANADGTAERKLATYRNPPGELDAPAWSPDGTRIAYAVINRDTNDGSIFEAHVADGSIRPVTSERWMRIIKLFWQKDGSGLLLLATHGDAMAHQVWYLDYAGGPARRLTNDLNNYSSMSFAGDTGAIAVVTSENEANIWIAPDNDVARLRPATSGAGKVDAPNAWTPDGRIVYHSNVSGTYDIWVTGVNGGAPQQLTRNARINQGPAVSPDGRTIVFLSDRSGAPHLWRMDLDGGNQRQLTNGPAGEQNPQFSPDGRWIVYRTALANATVWRMPAAGGGAVQLTDKIAFSPTVSPDSRWVAYLLQDQAASSIAIAPIDGGPPGRTLPFTTSVPLQRALRWTPDGRAIAYVDIIDGVSNVFAQPLDGGPRIRVTNFDAGRIFGFAWSADGRQLAVSRGTTSSDVVLLRDSR